MPGLPQDQEKLNKNDQESGKNGGFRKKSGKLTKFKKSQISSV